jgi:DNA modification methylase
MYSKKKDYILDPMVGSGTTLIEAKLLNRNALGVDINPEAVELSNNALKIDFKTDGKQKAILGNAKELINLKNDSIDLIITHPPYLNIVKYSDGKIEEDLSSSGGMVKFLNDIEIISKELFRVLKPNKFCAILIGDTRKRQHYVPISHYLMERFLKTGFILKEEIIKAQHNCSYSNRWAWKAKKYKFYLIMHEHLFIFRKPNKNEDTSIFPWSKYAKPLFHPRQHNFYV